MQIDQELTKLRPWLGWHPFFESRCIEWLMLHARLSRQCESCVNANAAIEYVAVLSCGMVDAAVGYVVLSYGMVDAAGKDLMRFIRPTSFSLKVFWHSTSNHCEISLTFVCLLIWTPTQDLPCEVHSAPKYVRSEASLGVQCESKK